uniref:Transmembrane protein 128 n=1 Tax=Otolemur garnettii TaxID=30611 RepID=H0WHM3_OTOGA
MDASRAREQLRRRFLLPPDAEAPLDGEDDARPETSTAVEKNEKPLPRLNIHSGFWILASIAVTYYVDFFKTLKENFHTSSLHSWFLLGSALLLVSLSIASYCVMYLEWYRGIGEYDVRYPALIPITTATFIAAGICFNIALWHVWSFLTPVLLFTQFMGVVMLISLLG